MNINIYMYNTYKYFQNMLYVCVFIYKYTQYTHILCKQ